MKNKTKIGIIPILFLCISSLACNLPLTDIFGPGGSRATGTPDTYPAATVPPTATSMPTPTAPAEAEVTPGEEITQGIEGQWSGTARWLCDDNPPWTLVLDFKSEQSATATLSGPGEPVVAEAGVTLDGNQIELQFELALWTGTITGNSMAGTFSDETCSGEWSVSR